MNAKRKSILNRAARGLGALLVAAGIGAIQSPDFRTFVGNDTTTAVLLGALVPALLAADKWLRVRKA